MALYDGTYCDLRELHCAMCNVSGSGQPSGALLRCSRCGVLHYCSVECQRQDFARHKKDCRGVQRAREKVEREAEPLRRYSAWGEEPCNLFETDVGEFWYMLETRAYMKERMTLIHKLSCLARESQTEDAWSLVAEHYLECLRLSMNDSNGLRFGLPFVLLRLNRDDDAYCFCRYWMLDNERGSASDRRRHRESNEGDWIYPRQKDSRYLDIFAECENIENQGDLSSLIAFAAIKMRLVAVLDARTKELERIASSTSSRAQPGAENVRRRIMGTVEQERTLADQRRQLDQLLNLVHRRNDTVLAAILNPSTALSQAAQPLIHRGTPSEALMLLPYVVDVWRAIPGAYSYLELHLGISSPSNVVKALGSWVLD